MTMAPGEELLLDRSLKVRVVKTLDAGRVVVEMGGATVVVDEVALSPLEA